MTPYLGEAIGTLLLVLLGDGVVANVLLTKSKGNNTGWIVITAGWALAVTIAVFAVNAISGAHLNPAVTIAAAVLGKFAWADVPGYIAAQMIGAFVGAVLVWLAYLPHWALTDDADTKLGVFCTAPAVRHPVSNLVTEAIGTAVLVLGAADRADAGEPRPQLGLRQRASRRCSSACMVWAIGLSLGGPTGYAINPARDLGPRIAHCDAADRRQGRCRTGATPGFRSSARSSAASLGALVYQRPVERVMKYILALDQGTTSSRAIVFDHARRPWSRSRRRSSGRSSRSPAGSSTTRRRSGPRNRAWRRRRSSGAARRRDRRRRDRHHQPARDDGGLGSRDRPADRQRDRLAGPPHGAASATGCGREGSAAMIRRKTGLVIDAYFSGTKLQWMLTHVPGARAGPAPASWRSAPSTRGSSGSSPAARQHVTDPSNASRTMLFNIQTGEWDDELLKLFGVPRSMLPEVRSSSEVYGECQPVRRADSRSPASRATSRRRSSARRARRPAW